MKGSTPALSKMATCQNYSVVKLWHPAIFDRILVENGELFLFCLDIYRMRQKNHRRSFYNYLLFLLGTVISKTVLMVVGNIHTIIINEETIPPKLLPVLVDFVHTYFLHTLNNLKRIVCSRTVKFLFKLLINYNLYNTSEKVH